MSAFMEANVCTTVFATAQQGSLLSLLVSASGAEDLVESSR